MSRLSLARLCAYLLPVALTPLLGCGSSTNFGANVGKTAGTADATPAGGKGGTGDGGANPPGGGGTTPQGPSGLASLTWFLQCDAAPATPPAAKDARNPVIAGAGPHSVENQSRAATPVNFTGKLCKPPQNPRDVVFIIDVSGSMAGDLFTAGNDPRVGNSCGRLAAVQAVIASIPASSGTQYSVVTFSSGVEKASSAMFATEAQLFADLDGGGNIADVLCLGNGSTNYDAALTEAGHLLSGGRPSADKEIYFLSDGQPDSGADGVAVATALKTTGVSVGGTEEKVTIATVMLNGTDQVLEKQIASVGPSGKPLHAYANQASSLAAVLTQLAGASITAGTLQYRAIGQKAWTTVTLMNYVQGFDFTLPSINISKDQTPNGIEVQLDYFDQHGSEYKTGGTLVWTTSGGGGQDH